MTHHHKVIYIIYLYTAVTCKFPLGVLKKPKKQVVLQDLPRFVASNVTPEEIMAINMRNKSPTSRWNFKEI